MKTYSRQPPDEPDTHDTPPMRLDTRRQLGRYESPWSLRHRIGLACWRLAWTLLCRPTPKPLYRWRNLVLQSFGGRVTGRPFIDSSATIWIPWHVELHDRACIGYKAVVYSLGRVVLGRGCTVAQESYLCGGTHNFTDPALPLMTGEIIIGEEAFVGARAFIMPGVHIGQRAIVGACSVVTSDVEEYAIVAGNPCQRIGTRKEVRSNEAKLD